jgi:aldose 1-epimerase
MTDAALATVDLADPLGELEATFVPSAGMLCCSLRHRGEELLAQRDGASAYAQRGKTMGVPLLYPWANRLAAFDYTVGDRTIAVPHDRARVALDGNGLPIHGVIGGRLGWELGPLPASGASSLVAQLSWSASRPELFEVFPFRHDLQYQARLLGGRLEVSLSLHACGSDVVPVAFGFHPYLSPGPARERWHVQLPAMRRLALDERQIPSGPGRLCPAQRFELAEREFDDGFDEVAETARFEVAARRRRIALELVEGYSCAQVFAPRAGQFICFEPMTAPANALCAGRGLRVLEPGERFRATFAISVLEDDRG